MVDALTYIDGDINVQSEDNVTWEGTSFVLVTRNNQWVIADVNNGNDVAFGDTFTSGSASAHENNPINENFSAVNGSDSYSIVAEGDTCPTSNSNDSSSSDSNNSNSSAGAQGDPHISPLFGKKYTI